MKYKFIPSRDKKIISLCGDKRVLHIGACDWPYAESKAEKGSLLYIKIDEVCKEQVGIDLDVESIRVLNKLDLKKSRIIQHDMNTPLDFDYEPDVVVFGETIEHMMNLQICLENLKSHMNSDATMVVSTPNAYAFGNFINSIFGVEHQHPDHKALFSRQVLSQLFEANGFEIIDFSFTSLPAEQADKLNWKGKVVQHTQSLVSRLFPALSPTLLCSVKIKA